MGIVLLNSTIIYLFYNISCFVFQVQNALLSFEELSQQYPTDVRKRFSLGQELEPTDENGISVMCKEFVKVNILPNMHFI